MTDKDKTKKQLISELTELRRRNAELVIISLGEERGPTNTLLGGSKDILETIIDAVPT